MKIKQVGITLLDWQIDIMATVETYEEQWNKFLGVKVVYKRTQKWNKKNKTDPRSLITWPTNHHAASQQN